MTPRSPSPRSSAKEKQRIQQKLLKLESAGLRTTAPWFPTSDNKIPLEYFLSTSDGTLQNFALARLAHAANIRKEIKAMKEDVLIHLKAAGIAQWLLEHRAEVLRSIGAHLDRAGHAIP